MSRKPLKHSERKKVNALGRKERRLNHVEPLEYYLIVCEGEKTEPEYFEEIKKLINDRYAHRVEVERIAIDIRGEATNTLFLLERAKQYVDELRGQITQVWLVYDKDDFPPDRFDTTQYEAERLSNESEIKFHVAWSNQCIEYWFLLHFENLQSDIKREDYLRKLDEHFKRLGLGGYRKNRSDLFGVLMNHGNLKLAIRWANQRMDEHTGKTPSQSVPATRVHELVLELIRYISEDNEVKG
jgi:hypothetical protein